MKPSDRQRLRLRYRKDDALMYISHRDLIRLIFKLLRRAAIPFAFSGHFSPKPRVTFCPALSLGVMANNELLDIELPDGTIWTTAEADAALERLRQAAAPRDFAVELALLPPDSPSIAAQAAIARYHIFTSRELTAHDDSLLPPVPSSPDTQDGAKRALRGLISWQVESNWIVVHGRTEASCSLNIVRTSAWLTENCGLEVLRLCRERMLSSEEREL